jgi:hypothetical protein
MVERPMESRNIAVEHANDKAVKIRHHTPIQKNVEKRFSKRIKSVVVYVDLTNVWGFTCFSDCVDKKTVGAKHALEPRE